MGSKKQIIAIVLLSVLLGGGAVGYSWHMGQTRASTFPGAGYVHIADPEQDVKQLAFQGGAVWRRSLSDTVSFTDTQGVQQKVSAMSFAHFDNRSLTALSRGVVVDLNDLDTAQMTNYYALAPTVTFANTGSGYTLENSSTELSLNDFLWKISEDKYMLVSQGMELNLSEEDAREVGDYVEITYVDEGVIQLQTIDNVWQTVSDVCFVNLDNGDVVDLALRQVRDSRGEVLMDFSKMVVDSNSNIEVTPLTEELKNVRESVIPHFEITARDGEDGEDGAIGAPGQAGAPGEAGVAGNPGENGESGEDGKQGAPGEAGQNGAAGASGTNGAAGAPGKPGEAGEDGQEPPVAITTEVLSLPEFTLKDWTPTATGCRGTIMVQDKGRMLVPNGTKDKNGDALSSRVYVVDALTGAQVGTNKLTTTPYAFDTTAGGGYAFQFDGLAPDREYMLVVEAPLNTQTGSKGPYVRTFISKSFFTDSVGVYMEAEPSGEEPIEGSKTRPTVNLSVRTQEYAAGTVTNATVYLFASESVAAGETLDSLQQTNNSKILQQCTVTIDKATGKSEPISLFLDEPNGGNLAFNTTYYARVVATVNGTNMLPAQVLPLTTLKRRPTLGAPIITANRNNWGFDLTAGGVTDPDSGITGYQWEIIPEEFKDTPEKCPPELKKAVKAELANSITVPLDNDVLKPEVNYVVRLVANVNDNEKSYSVSSEWSNAAKVMGGELPLVTFTPVYTASPDKEDANQLNTDSGYYDQIVGTINVLSTGKSARLLLDEDHTAEVTVYSAGYYRKTLKVYLRDENHPDLPPEADPTKPYLVGRTDSDHTVRIEVSEGALKDLQTANFNNGNDPTPKSVNGLFPDMAYRLIVSGDLSNSGSDSHKIEENITVGACVVETAKLQWTGVSLTYDENKSTDRETIAEAELRLFATPQDENGLPMKVDDNLLDRQKKTLSSVTIKALRTASSTTDDYSALKLDNENFRTLLTSAGCEIPAEIDSLGELMAAGLPLRAGMFGNAYRESIKTASAAIIQVSMVQDYTWLQQNKQNWEYRETEDGGREYPNVNSFPLAISGENNDANRKLAEVASASEDVITFTIPLSPTPEDLPDTGNGFIRAQGRDSNNDGSVDTFELEPNYANGAKLARYITYYVFDRPDYKEEDYTKPEWKFDPKFDPNWGDDYQEKYKDVVKYKTPVTSVTGAAGAEKGTWLTKLRIPVPTSGTFANQMPKVDFVAMTAEAYYTELGHRTNQSADDAGLKIHKQAMADLEKNDGTLKVSPYDSKTNTWKMFYPDDSKEPTTGHQFIFAWTLEWEQANPGEDAVIRYYPFEMDAFRRITDPQTYKDYIPQSGVKDVPHPEPEVYAMPWKQDTKDQKRIIQWDLTVNDPAKAIVPADPNGTGGRMAILYEMRNAIDAVPLYVDNLAADGSTAKTQVKVHEQSRAKDAVYGKEYQTWMETVQRDTATIYVVPRTDKRDYHEVGVMVQRYTDKYLANQELPFNPGPLSGLVGSANGFSASTIAASTIKVSGAIPFYSRAFCFNFSEKEFNDTAPSDPGSKITKLTIDRDDFTPGTNTPISGHELNQYDITVEGDLSEVNGIRLKFGNVVLDKYFNGYLVDDVVETSPLRFRVHIDRELNDKDVAGHDVKFEAYVLYETGAEGYSYLSGSSAENPLGLRENMRNDASGSWRWKYLRYNTNVIPTVTSSDNSTGRPIKMGSMFRLVWQDSTGKKVARAEHAGWPYGIGLIPSRAKYMADLSGDVKENGAGIKTLEFSGDGVAATAWLRAATVNIPRQLAQSKVPVGNIGGNAFTDESHTEIHVPNTKPFIVYNYTESEGFANFIKVLYSVNQTLQKNLYFTLEEDVSAAKDGSDYTLMVYDTRKKSWVHNGALGQSDEATVNGQSAAVQSQILRQYNYNKAPDTTEEFRAGILKADTYYRVRAYYKVDSEYKLLKEVDRITGENKETNNMFTIKTSRAPKPTMSAVYKADSYGNKTVTVSAKLEHVERYYYTLELQNSEGEFITYLNYYYNEKPTPQDNSFNVGQFIDGLESLYYSEEVTTDGLVKDMTRPIHLNYGETYKVVMRAYNEDTGPAYGGSIENDDLLKINDSEEKPVTEFTVTNEEDDLTLYGKFDLERDGSQINTKVTFTHSPAKNSRLIWQDKLAPVVIWAHDGQYTDITDRLQGMTDEIVNFNGSDIELDVTNDQYKEGDQFYCYMYGIMESGTTTGGIGDLSSPADREFILGTLNDTLKGPLDGRILSTLQGFTEEVELGGKVIGNRVLLASSAVTHRGEDTHAGTVSVNWYPDKSNDILVTLSDPVELTAIKNVHWTIRATFVSESGSSAVKSGELKLQDELNGDSFAISPMFNPPIPGDAQNVTYYVTLFFTKDDDKTRVNLSAAQSDGVSVTADRVLSCTLSPRGTKTSTFSSMLRSIRDFFAAPFRKED